MFRRGKLTFLSTKDDRIKIINERINQTERHLMEMCSAFATCTRKMAKYRDGFDLLAKGIKCYADDEEINESLAAGLKSFTNAVTILSDYMDINVHRMELKIVNELAQFEQLCKTTRDNLRLAVIARDKEVLKQRQMLELKSKFSANNSAADSELVKAKLEVQRTNKEIDELIGNFEQRKLADIKSVLCDFILISMKYHTKALEVLSANYYDISNIDEKDDFLVFQKLMKSKEAPSNASRKLALKKGLRSQSMDSLEREQLMSPLKRSGKLSRSTKNLAGDKKAATSDDDNNDDDDDEEDDAEHDEDESDDDDDDEDDENADTSVHDSARSEQDSGSASDDERPAKAKPRENVFGARTRSSKLETIGGNINISGHKGTRSAIKHPFKAVAATHVQKTKSQKKRKSKAGISGVNSGGAVLTGGGMVGGGGRLVTVVESKRKSSVERPSTAFMA